MRILSVARDREIGKARHDALIAAGFEVASAYDFQELRNLCKESTFDLVIIGHGIEPAIKQAIASLVRSYHPKVEILEIFSGQPQLHGITALGSMDVTDLVRRVEEIRERKRAVAMAEPQKPRRYPRVAVPSPVKVKISAPGVSLTGYLLDTSDGGLGITVIGEPLTIGQVVTVDLEAAPEKLPPLRGRVRYSTGTRHGVEGWSRQNVN
jgi:hypothetical protein